ncbi:hypothetical protein DFH28DRAFT_891206, partial [Melampsora americana]
SSAGVSLKLSNLYIKDTFQPRPHTLGQPSQFALYNYFTASGKHLRILTISKEIFQHGLQLTKSDIWADKCSRCFGPAKNEVKGSEREADFIVCMDGNFQHRHNKLASKDTPEERHYPAIFVRPSQIAEDQNPTNPKSRANDDPCSDAHKAANDTRSSSTWDKCDDTGLFAAACRHDVPLLMANIYQSGEKMYYPITLLQTLLDEFPPEKRFGVLYDIGCHLDKHIKLVSHPCKSCEDVPY